jgi:hypothetical protein
MAKLNLTKLGFCKFVSFGRNGFMKSTPAAAELDLQLEGRQDLRLLLPRLLRVGRDVQKDSI